MQRGVPGRDCGNGCDHLRGGRAGRSVDLDGQPGSARLGSGGPPTRERVLAAATELNYIPSGAASSLATKNVPALGLVLPHLEGEYYADLLIGFELAAAELGYTVTVTLANQRANASTAVRSLAEGVQAWPSWPTAPRATTSSVNSPAPGRW